MIGQGWTNTFAQHATSTTELTRCEKSGCCGMMNLDVTEEFWTIIGWWPMVGISIGVVEEVKESMKGICELWNSNGLSNIWEITRVTRLFKCKVFENTILAAQLINTHQVDPKPLPQTMIHLVQRHPQGPRHECYRYPTTLSLSPSWMYY